MRFCRLLGIAALSAWPAPALAQAPSGPPGSDPAPAPAPGAPAPAPAEPGPAASPATGNAPAPDPVGAPTPEASPAPEAGAPPAAQPAEADASPPSGGEPPPAVAAPEEEADDVPVPVPPARDTLGGHFILAAGGGFALPFGDFEGSVPQSLMDPGWMLTADLGVGVSRLVAVGAWGQFIRYGDDACDAGACDASSIAAGLFVRYHLVQGVRFDPWIAAGPGFRVTNLEAGSYSGVEWLRVQLGGDWYFAPNLGFGPFIELAAGTYFSKSDGPDLEDRALHWNFGTGLRLVFDAPGKHP